MLKNKERKEKKTKKEHEEKNNKFLEIIKKEMVNKWLKNIVISSYNPWNIYRNNNVYAKIRFNTN